MSGTVRISGVSIERRIVMTDTGRLLRITNGYDTDSEECPLTEAAVLIAGSEAYPPVWITLDMRLNWPELVVH